MRVGERRYDGNDGSLDFLAKKILSCLISDLMEMVATSKTKQMEFARRLRVLSEMWVPVKQRE